MTKAPYWSTGFLDTRSFLGLNRLTEPQDFLSAQSLLCLDRLTAEGINASVPTFASVNDQNHSRIHKIEVQTYLYLCQFQLLKIQECGALCAAEFNSKAFTAMSDNLPGFDSKTFTVMSDNLPELTAQKNKKTEESNVFSWFLQPFARLPP